MEHTWTRLVASVAVFALAAGACGDGDDATTTTTSVPGVSTTTTVPVTTTLPGAGPETTTTDATVPVDCADPVTVGLLTDQSGALAIYGAHMLRGVPAGFEFMTGDDGSDGSYTLGGCDIRLVVADDRSDPELSVNAARELIEVDGADILIGSVSSSVTAALQGIALENDVILIAAPAASNDLTGAAFNPNTFRASRSGYQDAMTICAGLADRYDSFVQIAPDSSFGSANTLAYRDACTAAGGEFPADDVIVPADTTDFTPYLEQAAEVDADVLLVTWSGSGFIQLMQEATDLGVGESKAVVSPFIDNQAMPAFFSNAIGTTSSIAYHYSLADTPANDFLVERAAEDGTFPDLFDPAGFRAAQMVVEALKVTGGAADADSLRDALEGLTFEGPKGPVEVRAEDHVLLQDMYVVTLRNVDDPEFLFYEYVATIRPEPPCLLEGDFVDRCGDLPVGSLSG